MRKEALAYRGWVWAHCVCIYWMLTWPRGRWWGLMALGVASTPFSQHSGWGGGGGFGILVIVMKQEGQ